MFWSKTVKSNKLKRHWNARVQTAATVNSNFIILWRRLQRTTKRNTVRADERREIIVRGTRRRNDYYPFINTPFHFYNIYILFFIIYPCGVYCNHYDPPPPPPTHLHKLKWRNVINTTENVIDAFFFCLRCVNRI